MSAAHGDSEALASLPAVVGRAQQLYRNSQFQKRVWEVVAIAIRDVLNEDRLSLAEEERISRLAGVLGVNLAELPHRNFDLWEELAIAGINAGRLPRVSDSPIVTKPGEIVHAAMIVDLMKEVAVREMRGGYSGVSIRVMKGVSYRVGQVRAHSVVVGTQLQVQDTGTLAITSKRAVFVGRQKTLEFRYDPSPGDGAVQRRAAPERVEPPGSLSLQVQARAIAVDRSCNHVHRPGVTR